MIGDEECKEMHKKAKPTLNVTGLVNQIKQLEEEINEVDQLLDDHSVPHVDVSYERLYNVQDIALEWRRVFSFIGVGPSADQLTSADLVAHMEHAATSNSSASLRAKIQNYEEVVKTLQGTKYEAYLYPAFLDPRKAFDVKFLGQVIGTGHRICVDGSGRELSRKRLNCWISPQIENENINGPMPLYVRPWMAEIFQTSSVLVFVSSHSSFASTSHEDIRIIAAEKTIVGLSTHYDETIWKELNVTLRFESHACKSLHSPSIAVDDENQRLYMYIHGHRCNSLGNNIQPTLVFSSEDGINWSTPTASSQRDPFVFRDLFYMSVPVFYDGHYFSIAKRGGSTVLCRGASLLGPWEQGQVLNEGTRHVRHGDIHIRGNHLYVFFTVIGDSPERIVLGDIYMSHALDWKDWKLHLGPILFEPEYYHEHGSAELKMSEMGPAKGILRQLRDPHFLSDKESPKDYLNGLLFYTAQGEQGIAIARISLCTSKYQNAVKTETRQLTALVNKTN